MDQTSGRFARCDAARNAGAFILGVPSTLESKNCWTMAELSGHQSPDKLQHSLSRAKWDADDIRDDLFGYVTDAFAEPDAVLVVDETGDLKKGTKTVGVQRQYSGTAGRIENCQVAVYMTYTSSKGHTLIDRALYMPRSWTDDRARPWGSQTRVGRLLANWPGVASSEGPDTKQAAGTRHGRCRY